MKNEDIKKLALEFGFTERKQSDGQNDLNLYVYTFANALIDLAEKNEREECAKLAEQTVCDTHIPSGIKIYGGLAAKVIRGRVV